MTFPEAIAARRAFRLPSYTTLAEAGFDGDYVSPIQISSGNPDGPLLMTKDWLDAPSARAHHAELSRRGYLPGIPFNRVLDKALELAGLTRADIYIAPVFCLLPPTRSHPLPARDARSSFEQVTSLELNGRRPVAAGTDAARTLAHFRVPHIATSHPSARGLTFAARAERLAHALHRAS